MVFVSAGKGVGQYRVVIGTDRQSGRTVLNLDHPWRVVPDRSSRITLTTANRQNLIVGNTIDAGFIDSRCKVAGILFWFNGFENVIAGNILLPTPDGSACRRILPSRLNYPSSTERLFSRRP